MVSTLQPFRDALATHLSHVLEKPIESLLPLIQQDTAHRKAGHGVFSVPVKRLFMSSRNDKSLVVAEEEEDEEKKNKEQELLEKCISQLSSTTLQYIENPRRSKDILLFDPKPSKLIDCAIHDIYNSMAVATPLQQGREQQQQATLAPETPLSKTQPTASSSPVSPSPKQPEPAAQLEHQLTTGTTTSKKRARSSDHRTTILVNGLSLQYDENGFCALRRTVMTGFMARLMMQEGVEEKKGSCVRVAIEEPFADDMMSKSLYEGLNTDPITDDSQVNSILEWIKDTLRTNSHNGKMNVVCKDGSWFVELSEKNLGQIKVYTPIPSTTTANASVAADDKGATRKDEKNGVDVDVDMEMGRPTLLVQTLARMASHFAADDSIQRYLWIIPDGRRQFAEQLLSLAKLIFSTSLSPSSIAECVVHRRERSEQGEEKKMNMTTTTTTIPVTSSCVCSSMDHSSSIFPRRPEWPQMVEMVIFGPSVGNIGIPKLEEDVKDIEKCKVTEGVRKGIREMSWILDHAYLRMGRIIVEERGRGVSEMVHNDDDFGDDDDDDDGIKIKRKSGVQLNINADLSLLYPYPESFHLALLISEWGDVLQSVERTLDPQGLVNYLFRLSAEIGQAHRALRVKDMERRLAEARWMLFWSAKQVLERGFELLGLDSVERM
ncbi:Arginyl-tRNA synthetase [Podila epigama]|nr:Arginyl-tRNA synthetase [Podila epigama]